jgi:hypothetical protein
VSLVRYFDADDRSLCWGLQGWALQTIGGLPCGSGPPTIAGFLLHGIFFGMAWQFPFFQRETEVNSR